jgi:hypothetical protein
VELIGDHYYTDAPGLARRARLGYMALGDSAGVFVTWFYYSNFGEQMHPKNWIPTLALAVSLGASAARADLSCPEYMPKPFSSIETRIEFDGKIYEGTKVDCEKIGTAARVVSEISDMLAPDLDVPASLMFRMVDAFDNAFFNPLDLSLNMPFQIMFGKYSKHPTHTLPVLAHEYGHAILNVNLAKLAPQWKNIIRQHAAESAGLPAEVLDFLVGPYHEFFADVVAGLYTEEGDSVSHSLSVNGLIANLEGSPSECPNREEKCRPRQTPATDMREYFANRDFTDRGNELSRWKPTRVEDIHSHLAPARYHVWKYYLSDPAIRHEKARIAAVIVDAIIQDVNERIARLSESEITPERMKQEFGDLRRTNREFIDVLDEFFDQAF